MMALGVSLANELDSVKAMEILKKWINGNEKYFFKHQDNVAAESGESIFPDYDFSRLKKEVFDLFERAAQIDPEDPDVHVALGVLHNINRNYSFAVAALLKAVNLRPLDFASWNKLGATLANAGLSQEALGCYHQALALKPRYARAWSNLAIAHSNLEQYENASNFFLTAIQISPDCTHLWTSLVLALSHWQPENQHLHTLIERRDVEGLLRVMRDAPRISNLPEPVSIDRAQVDALTQSLRSKLLLNELPSKSV
jgi:peroxin-5